MRGGGGGCGRGRERKRAASGPAGNSPSEIRRGAIDFRSANDQYAGRRGGGGKTSPGEGVAKVFIVSRRHDARVFLRIGRLTARVLAGRCAIVCCLGGCVRFVSVFFSFPRSSHFPVFSPLHAARFARFDVFHSHQYFRTHAIARARAPARACRSRVRNDSQRPRPMYLRRVISKYPWNFR